MYHRTSLPRGASPSYSPGDVGPPKRPHLPVLIRDSRNEGPLYPPTLPFRPKPEPDLVGVFPCRHAVGFLEDPLNWVVNRAKKHRLKCNGASQIASFESLYLWSKSMSVSVSNVFFSDGARCDTAPFFCAAFKDTIFTFRFSMMDVNRNESLHCGLSVS